MTVYNSLGRGFQNAHCCNVSETYTAGCNPCEISPWNSMEFDEVFMKFLGIPWSSMDFHGVSMEFHGMPCSSMEFHVMPWNSMDFQLEFHGFSVGVP